MKRAVLRVWMATMVLATCSAIPAAGSEAVWEPPNELGVVLGVAAPDREIVGQSDGMGSYGPAVGLRVAHLFGRDFNWFGDGTMSWHGDNELSSGKAELFTARTGIEILFQSASRRRWFVGGAGGWSWADYEATGLDFDRPMVSVGFGQRWLSRSAGFGRWELRGDRWLGSDGLDGADLFGLQFLLGWAMPTGGPPPDADADGVPDHADRCPGTPRGAVVDSAGCPNDADGDGVFDGLDRCPGTPKGAKVDAAGCPTDADGDGVFDGMDRCPSTPRGARVDASGCPSDADADGVVDGVDRCPDTPKGAKVDAAGCPIDSDGDGVADGIDRCPDTPSGRAVDPQGCPVAPPKRDVPASLPTHQAPLVLEGVTFASSSAELTPSSRANLDRVAESLREYPEVRVLVAGHTDSTGGDALNRALSQKRADAVRGYLVSAGVPPGQIEAKGFGPTEPVADNRAPEGRARNRRVELRRL